MTHLTQSQLAERYVLFMQKCNESLPASMSDAERKAAVLEALDKQMERDITETAESAMADLNTLYDGIVLEQEAKGQVAEDKELEKIRQGL